MNVNLVCSMPTYNSIIKSISDKWYIFHQAQDSVFQLEDGGSWFVNYFYSPFSIICFCSVSFLSFCFKVCPLCPVPSEAAHSRFYSALRRLVTSQHIANRYAIFPCSLDVEIKSSWDTLYVTSLFLPIYLRQHNAQCFLAHSTTCMRWDSLCVGRTRITLSLPRLA